MNISTQDILEKALGMEETERAFIAERLIASLETQIDPDTELAWQIEVQKRASELDSGKVKTVPWEEVKSKLQQELSVQH